MADGAGEQDGSYNNILEAVRKLREEHSVDGGNRGEPPKRQKLALPKRAKPPSVETIKSLQYKDTSTNLTSQQKSIGNVPQKLVDRIDMDGLRDPDRNNASSGIAHTSKDKSTPRVNDFNNRKPEILKEQTSTKPNGSNLHTFNQVQVAKSQTGNPLLEYLNIFQMNSKIKDVDYVINSKCVALFLSLKYHKLHPEYIYNKMKKVTYTRDDILRVLLVLVDIEDFQDTVRELNKLALFNKITIILAFSNEQCAIYLQNLKYVEREASKRIIQGVKSKDEEVLADEGKFLERLVDTVSSIKSITTSDAKSLLGKYGSIKALVEADAAGILSVEGMGDLKTDRFLQTLHQPW